MTGRHWSTIALLTALAVAVPAAAAGADPGNGHPKHTLVRSDHAQHATHGSAQTPSRHAGDHVRHAGAHGRHAGAHGRHAGPHGRHAGAHGRHAGAHGRHAGAHGRHAGAHGRHSRDGTLQGSQPAAVLTPHGKRRSGTITTRKHEHARNLQPALAARNGNGRHRGALMHAAPLTRPTSGGSSGGTPGRRGTPTPSAGSGPAATGVQGPGTPPAGGRPANRPTHPGSNSHPGSQPGPSGKPSGRPGGTKPAPESAAELLQRLVPPPLTLLPLIVISMLALCVAGLVGLARYRNNS
jgi:hypothetical protein